MTPPPSLCQFGQVLMTLNERIHTKDVIITMKTKINLIFFSFHFKKSRQEETLVQLRRFRQIWIFPGKLRVFDELFYFELNFPFRKCVSALNLD